MPKDVVLSEKQAETLETFCTAFDMTQTGAWPSIEAYMRDAGIDDPEDALENARVTLRGGEG